MQTRASKLGITGFLAALLFVGMTGCGKETVTSVPPTATALAPAPGATNVPVNQVVTASFSAVMNAASITTSTFVVSGPGGAVAGAVSYSGTTASFVPAANLAFNTVYTATVTTGAANALGVQMASNYMWTFTTAGVPTVVSTVPSAGAV